MINILTMLAPLTHTDIFYHYHHYYYHHTKNILKLIITQYETFKLSLSENNHILKNSLKCF